jgi:hypothetical protein
MILIFEDVAIALARCSIGCFRAILADATAILNTMPLVAGADALSTTGLALGKTTMFLAVARS